MIYSIKRIVVLIIVVIMLTYSTAQAEISMDIFDIFLDNFFDNSTKIVRIDEQNCINVYYGEFNGISYPFTLQLALASVTGDEKDSIHIRGFTDCIIEDTIDAVLLTNHYNQNNHYTTAYVDSVIRSYFTIDHYSYCSDIMSEDIFLNVCFSLVEINQFVDFLKRNGYSELNNIIILPE